MSNLLGRLKEFVGMPDAEGYEDFGGYDEVQGEDFTDLYAPDEAPNTPEQQYSSQSDVTRGPEMNTVSTGSNVVGMPGSNRFWGSATEVLVMEPNAFEEMPQVIQALRERKSVVLNLTMMDPAQAQRAVDFVAGATYTIDGHQERVGDSIFLFTPSCVQVSTQFGVVHEAPPQPSRPTATPAYQPQEQTVLSQIAQ